MVPLAVAGAEAQDLLPVEVSDFASLIDLRLFALVVDGER